MSDELLTPQEIAEGTKLSRRAIYRAIEEGELRAVKLRSKLRVERAEYRRWLDASQVAPSGELQLFPPSQGRPPEGRFRRRLRAVDFGGSA